MPKKRGSYLGGGSIIRAHAIGYRRRGPVIRKEGILKAAVEEWKPEGAKSWVVSPKDDEELERQKKRKPKNRGKRYRKTAKQVLKEREAEVERRRAARLEKIEQRRNHDSDFDAKYREKVKAAEEKQANRKRFVVEVRSKRRSS
ncbi:hypothetical protein [Primorskyibacter sp. S87]|uniref:hypothetical protein n=1 Tax=Primorskyibacter sp. S87 TaxID=3415126 RepID=UPI003C7CC2BA